MIFNVLLKNSRPLTGGGIRVRVASCKDGIIIRVGGLCDLYDGAYRGLILLGTGGKNTILKPASCNNNTDTVAVLNSAARAYNTSSKTFLFALAAAIFVFGVLEIINGNGPAPVKKKFDRREKYIETYPDTYAQSEMIKKSIGSVIWGEPTDENIAGAVSGLTRSFIANVGSPMPALDNCFIHAVLAGPVRLGTFASSRYVAKVQVIPNDIHRLFDVFVGSAAAFFLHGCSSTSSAYESMAAKLLFGRVMPGCDITSGSLFIDLGDRDVYDLLKLEHADWDNIVLEIVIFTGAAQSNTPVIDSFEPMRKKSK